MNHVLYLSAIPLAAALPIDSVPAASNGVTFFAVLFTTLSTLTFLCVSKSLFKKSRRSWFTRLAALAPTSAPTGNKASILSKLLHTQPRPGLLVGFLGSPTWETSLTLNVHKTLHERRRSFFAVDNPPPKYWYSSLSFRDSNTSRHRHLSSISFGRALEFSSLVYQPENGTVLFTPRPPPPALYDSTRVIPRRRYSLPSIVRNAQHAQIKRSYSTKARRIKHRRPEVDSISFAPVLPEKALNNSVAHILPLPFSPLLDTCSERYPKLLGPAPDTPSPPAQTTNYGSNRALCSPTDESFKNLPSLIAEHESMMDCNLSKADTQDSNCETANVVSPLVLNAIPNISIDLDDEPLPPLNSVVMFQLRPRYRLLSVRTKRSPPLGPSPLRTMILPESDSDLSPRTSREDPSMMTLCEPNTFGADVETLTSAKKKIIGGQTPRNIEDIDTDRVLGLIRELAEEVNDWDDGLFMDKNFKSMIDNSQDILLAKRCGQSTPNSPDSAFDRITESLTKGVPRSRDTEVNECAHAMLSGGGQLISFWGADSEHRDEIGIAQ